MPLITLPNIHLPKLNLTSLPNLSSVPNVSFSNLNVDLQVFATIGTLIVGSVAIAYSLFFIGKRFTTPRKVRARLRGGVIAAVLVIALAVLNIYLTVTLS
jgi:hypothetical protein